MRVPRRLEAATTTGGAIPNIDGVVPMIPVENNPDMLPGGTSDLDVVIPLQDRVNKLCLDLDVGSEFHAAPQRWAAGWEPPTDDDGKPLPNTQIEAATSRFLAFSDPDTTVGSLPPGDPAAYVEPIEMYIQHIAAISANPAALPPRQDGEPLRRRSEGRGDRPRSRR